MRCKVTPFPQIYQENLPPLANFAQLAPFFCLYLQKNEQYEYQATHQRINSSSAQTLAVVDHRRRGALPFAGRGVRLRCVRQWAVYDHVCQHLHRSRHRGLPLYVLSEWHCGWRGAVGAPLDGVAGYALVWLALPGGVFAHRVANPQAPYFALCHRVGQCAVDGGVCGASGHFLLRYSFHYALPFGD